MRIKQSRLLSAKGFIDFNNELNWDYIIVGKIVAVGY